MQMMQPFALPRKKPYLRRGLIFLNVAAAAALLVAFISRVQTPQLNVGLAKFSLRTSRPSRVLAYSKVKKVDLKKQGVNSIEDDSVRANLQGRSKAMDSPKWVDPQGRKGRGLGVYRFQNKYGANVDGYSPIYTPDIWSDSGNSYKLGSNAIAAWLVVLLCLFAVGANLIYTTSQAAS
mmetsp:Transcript_17519/g.24458  ORF Transcript_17519/g.24458 Transcript_17519/m.24458 type:complete len:178 (+) Transcript_17519:94-627(+)